MFIISKPFSIGFIILMSDLSHVLQLSLQVLILNILIDLVDILMKHGVELVVMVEIVKVNVVQVSQSSTKHQIKDDVTFWTLLNNIMSLKLF